MTISCKKDDLPAATQEGKNIMAAKVNGKVWKATACFSCTGGGSGLNVSYEQSFINIGGEQKNENTIYILINFKASKTGKYIIKGSYGFDSDFIRLFINNVKYKTSMNMVGDVIITKIDTSNKILSGTFSFKAENENDPNDVITVTDGRFDVTYN